MALRWEKSTLSSTPEDWDLRDDEGHLRGWVSPNLGGGWTASVTGDEYQFEEFTLKQEAMDWVVAIVSLEK